MRRFDNLTFVFFGVLIIVASCRNENVDKEYFVIGEHREKIVQETINHNQPPPPPPPSMNFYPYVNILLTDSNCYVHFDNSRRYSSCGTGVDFSYVRRLNLEEDQIIILNQDFDSFLKSITNRSPDKIMLDIASEKDTIRNSLFPMLLESISKQGFDYIRVRNFTEEEKCILYKKIYNIPCNIDSLNWDIKPKIDALFDLNKDGSFEIKESFNNSK